MEVAGVVEPALRHEADQRCRQRRNSALEAAVKGVDGGPQVLRHDLQPEYESRSSHCQRAYSAHSCIALIMTYACGDL